MAFLLVEAVSEEIEMLKKIFLMTIVTLVVNLTIVPFAFASDKAEKEAKFAEKVKTEITKLGVGKDARIKVKLKDGTKLKGYVSEIKDSEFVVTDLKTGTSTSVAYSNAKQVKGNNLSSSVVIAIGVGVVVVIFLILLSKSS